MIKPDPLSPNWLGQAHSSFQRFLIPASRRFALAMVIVCIAFSAALAQDAQPDRGAQWKAYTLPTSEFRRIVDETYGVILRVPSGWKQETATSSGALENSYRFIGPYSTVLQVSIEKIPEGLPLQSYIAQIAQQLRSLPGSADSLSVRQTEMSGL